MSVLAWPTHRYSAALGVYQTKKQVGDGMTVIHCAQTKEP